MWVNKRGIMGIFGAGTEHASHRVAHLSHSLSSNFLAALFLSARESTRKYREIAEPRIRTPSPRYKANYWISRDGKQGTDWSRSGTVHGTTTTTTTTTDGGERLRRGVGVDAAQERIGASGAASLLPTTWALLPALSASHRTTASSVLWLWIVARRATRVCTCTFVRVRALRVCMTTTRGGPGEKAPAPVARSGIGRRSE